MANPFHGATSWYDAAQMAGESTAALEGIDSPAHQQAAAAIAESAGAPPPQTPTPSVNAAITPVRGVPPPEDMYDTELAALEAQLNHVPGIQRQAITREISQIQQIEAKQATTTSTPQPPSAQTAPAGTPETVAYALATGSPFKTADGQVMELVSIAFQKNPSDPFFAGVDIWFTGYHGSKTPQLMASGTTSPVSFLASITKETVTYAVQSFGSSGLSSPMANAPSASFVLDGVQGAPPQPSVTQSLTQTPTGYQFEFSQESGLEADVIAGYNIYSGSSDDFGSASKVDHVAQDPKNTGTVVWQDAQPSGVTMYYWVTAVNTSGYESAPTACQSAAVESGSGLNSYGQLVTGTPTTPVSDLDSASTKANTAIDSGNVIVAGAIDLSRDYTNKNLDNVPDGTSAVSMPAGAVSGTGADKKINLAAGAGSVGVLPLDQHDPGVQPIVGLMPAQPNADQTSDNPQPQSWLTDGESILNDGDSVSELLEGADLIMSALTGTQRNLVPDSDLKSGWAFWQNLIQDASKLQILPNQGAQFSGNSIWMDLGAKENAAQVDVALQPSTTYTLSAVVNGAPMTAGYVFCQVASGLTAYAEVDGNAGVAQARKSVTFTTPSSTDGMQVRFGQWASSGSPAGAGSVMQAQLEPGTTMTAYRPNFADDQTGYLPKASLDSLMVAEGDALTRLSALLAENLSYGAGGPSVQSLQPDQVGADNTASNPQSKSWLTDAETLMLIGSSLTLLSDLLTSKLSDDAGLGTKATWSGVSGTGKPADNADVTSQNTSANTAAVGSQTVAAAESAIAAANLGLNAEGQIIVGTAEQSLANINAGINAANSGLNSSGQLTTGTVATAVEDLDEATSRALAALQAEVDGVTALATATVEAIDALSLTNAPSEGGANVTNKHLQNIVALGSTSEPAIAASMTQIPEMVAPVTVTATTDSFLVVFQTPIDVETNKVGQVNGTIYVNGAPAGGFPWPLVTLQNTQSDTQTLYLIVVGVLTGLQPGSYEIQAYGGAGGAASTSGVYYAGTSRSLVAQQLT